MHETALMQNMLAIVERAAREQEGAVAMVHLRIGEMAGVSIDALRFAFDVLSRGTRSEGATLEIERIPLSIRCMRCGVRTHPGDLVFRCGECGATDIEIVGGREMEVDYIEVGEESGGSGGDTPRAEDLAPRRADGRSRDA
jgi:hydrogenase nickel incorporation protein HypA/HybF